jgi:hypothetical protein
LGARRTGWPCTTGCGAPPLIAAGAIALGTNGFSHPRVLAMLRVSPQPTRPRRAARYGAGMAGGQFLRGPLAKGLGLAAGPRGATPGIRYYQFDKVRRRARHRRP